MAYICDDCKYIFPRKRTNCPYCGGRIYNSSRSEADLQADGYTFESVRSGRNSGSLQPDPEQADSFSYDDLRAAFFSSHPAEEPQAVPAAASRTSNPRREPAVSSQRTQAPAQSPPVSRGTDYFSQFSSASQAGPSVPRVEPVPLRQNPEIRPVRDLFRQELAEPAREARRMERQYRRRSAMDTLAGIRWGAAARILLVIFVVIMAVTIWQMRHVIFQSILSFFISLLPAILLIWILWRLLRAAFRW